MRAQPAPEPAAEDLVEILHALPERHRDQFLAEYRAAVEQARQPERYARLTYLLLPWRRSRTLQRPGYQDRLRTVRGGHRATILALGSLMTLVDRGVSRQLVQIRAELWLVPRP
jgi:hypothetical protein